MRRTTPRRWPGTRRKTSRHTKSSGELVSRRRILRRTAEATDGVEVFLALPEVCPTLSEPSPPSLSGDLGGGNGERNCQNRSHRQETREQVGASDDSEQRDGHSPGEVHCDADAPADGAPQT